MKTVFTFRNGTKRFVPEKTAKALRRIHLGTYETRDMVADRAFTGKPDTRAIHEVDAKIEADNAGVTPDPVGDSVGVDPEPVDDSDGLDSLDRDALFAIAAERGVTVHHRAGADKIRSALRGE